MIFQIFDDSFFQIFDKYTHLRKTTKKPFENEKKQPFYFDFLKKKRKNRVRELLSGRANDQKILTYFTTEN